MNPADLDAEWRAIERPTTAGALAGRAAPQLDPDRGVLVAIDDQGLRHLLISTEEDGSPPGRPATKGLAISLDELRVGDRAARHYFDVACRDATMHTNFTAIAAEIIEALEDARADTADVLDSILARWRWFWGVTPDALTEEQAIGLFGELWFLEFWLPPIDAAVLGAWTGPPGDRHDFKWDTASIEIKATRARSDGAAKHRITNLDQLDAPERGELYLFSLRVTVDPIGAHSLNTSIDRIRAGLSAQPELLHALDERLALLGYNPAHRRQYDAQLRVVAEELYRVEEDFPRLTRSSFPHGVPNGVDDIAYTLDLVACAPWRVATAPSPEARHLRANLT